MAYQIIKHRIVKPIEYAVHFECSCGCEFWADQNSVTEYCMRGGLDVLSSFIMKQDAQNVLALLIA